MKGRDGLIPRAGAAFNDSDSKTSKNLSDFIKIRSIMQLFIHRKKIILNSWDQYSGRNFPGGNKHAGVELLSSLRRLCKLGAEFFPPKLESWTSFLRCGMLTCPAGLPSLSEMAGLSTQIPGTPPPPQQLHFTCDLAQPVAGKEPLNSAPKQL